VTVLISALAFYLPGDDTRGGVRERFAKKQEAAQWAR